MTDQTQDTPESGGQIDPKLLEILVCPTTKKPLIYDRENEELISVSAGVAFPIRDGIPIMLVGEARELNEAEIAKHKSRRF
ncbi:MAG: Trm112 family protein [Pseudomonadota bacterium]